MRITTTKKTTPNKKDNPHHRKDNTEKTTIIVMAKRRYPENHPTFCSESTTSLVLRSSFGKANTIFIQKAYYLNTLRVTHQHNSFSESNNNNRQVSSLIIVILVLVLVVVSGTGSRLRCIALVSLSPTFTPAGNPTLRYVDRSLRELNGKEKET